MSLPRDRSAETNVATSGTLAGRERRCWTRTIVSSRRRTWCLA